MENKSKNNSANINNSNEKLLLSDDNSVQVCYCGHILESIDWMEGMCLECGLLTPQT